MNVLVIGGNGFIGSHLIDALIQNNHSVRVFDHGHEKFRSPNPKIDYRIGDIKDGNYLYEAMLNIDVVFHLASGSVPSSSNLNIEMDITKNVFPTILILDNMVKLGIKKIVYFSSGGAVYGEVDDLPIKETNVLEPISSYGITKVTIENYIKLYNRNHSIEYLIIRPSNPYGPRQGHFLAQGVISTFLRKIKANESLSIFGNGENKKDYIFVDDLVHYVYDLFVKSKEGIYNVGSGNGTSINEIVNVIEEVTSKTCKIEYAESKKYDVKDFTLDISKVKDAIEKDFNTDIKNGIEKTWNWLKNESNFN
ncbi:NAD-dependent epimerase/dehydratase family protein [Flavobacterium sp. 2]|uniref:NAD-dependent epimerase/dehydratase family protein n=1 Tax=Flavobacterium sp. 2 TaxID=308053 RepID=UPI003CECD0A4